MFIITFYLQYESMSKVLALESMFRKGKIYKETENQTSIAGKFSTDFTVFKVFPLAFPFINQRRKKCFPRTTEHKHYVSPFYCII